MKISTKGRYGTRLIIDIAVNGANGPVLLKDISKRQQISEKYLSQIVIQLKNLGLLTSVRGSKGGYNLAKKTSQITLLDIITAAEGSVCLVDCVDDEKSCKRASRCVSRDIWRNLARGVKDMMRSITLESMVESQKKITNNIVYQI